MMGRLTDILSSVCHTLEINEPNFEVISLALAELQMESSKVASNELARKAKDEKRKELKMANLKVRFPFLPYLTLPSLSTTTLFYIQCTFL